MKNRTAALALLACLFVVASGASAQVRADEEVIVFPADARLSADGSEWIAILHGWIFEPERDGAGRSLTLGTLRRLLGLEEGAEESKLFRERARWFLVDNERGKDLALRLAGVIMEMEESGPDGHWRGEVRIPAAAVEPGVTTVATRVEVPEDDDRVFEAPVHLVPVQGLSVVSDIDDTIKISHVTDKEALMEATFLREYEAVPGMAAVYERLRSSGAVFHYVTGSPWQLYPSLSPFLDAAGFPAGTWLMRKLRVKDESLKAFFGNPIEHKLAAVSALLERHPERRFLLVGDSGEQDPEVYGQIARRYPDQAAHIYIRNVTGEPSDSERYRQALEGVPPELWTIFEDAAEIDYAADRER